MISLFLAVSSFALTQSGCAIQTYDAKTGTAHLWGIGHLKMRVVHSEDNPKLQAIAVGTETIGIRVDTNQHTTGMTFGYDRASIVEIVESDTALRLDTVHSDPFTLRLGSNFPDTETGTR